MADKKEDMISLGDGDEIRFAGNSDKGPPAYSAIQFVHPTWKPPLPPATKAARDEAANLIAVRVQEKKRELKRMQEEQRRLQERCKANIVALEGKQEAIMKCTTMQEVENLMPDSLTGTKKRKVEDDPSVGPHMSFSPLGTKRENAQSQEKRQFTALRQKVIAAKRQLNNRPTRNDAGWNEKAKTAQALIDRAKITTCYFHANANEGPCRDGDKCLFCHNSCQASMTGRIKKIKLEEQGVEPYAFIRLDTCKDLFVPAENFHSSFEMARVGMKVKVHGTEPPRRKGRCEVAMRVTFV